MDEPHAGVDDVEERLVRAIAAGGPSEAELDAAAADSGAPRLLVVQWARYPRPGRLREAVERADLDYRQRRLDTLLGDVATVRAELRDDVARLLGRPAVTTPVRAWAIDLQATLVALDGPSAPREVHRRVRESVGLELGLLFQEAVGGTWSVRTDPGYLDRGAFVVGTWAPMQVVDNVTASSPEGMLADVLEDEIEGFREMSPATFVGPVGTWLAIVPPGRAVPLEGFAARTDYLDGTTARMQGEHLVLDIDDPISGRRTRVVVSLVEEDGEPVVEGLPPEIDAAPWRGARQQYTIVWELEYTDEAYNTVLIFAESLVAECGALVVDSATRNRPLAPRQ